MTINRNTVLLSLKLFSLPTLMSALAKTAIAIIKKRVDLFGGIKSTIQEKKSKIETQG